MSDTFNCPKCDRVYDISKLEMWNLYESEGKETEFDCKGCGSEMIITSTIVEWVFITELND